MDFSELIANLSNTTTFTNSLNAFFADLSINKIIIFIMMIFMVVGAVDKVRGNKLGYGEKFDEGFNAMGPLAIAMVGVVAVAPILRVILQPIISPIYKLLGANPAMFGGTLLANDMGGYSLATQLAGSDASIGNFSGLILGAMMGPTIVFIIPVALSIIKKKDRPFLASGVLVGLITIPIGCIVGGLAMNMTPLKINIITILVNLIPVIIVASIVALGLWYKPIPMMNGFNKFGNAITIIITISTAIAVFQHQTGIRFPLFDMMVTPNEHNVTPLEEGLQIVTSIAIVLIGAFPMVEWITRTFSKSLMSFGKKLKVNDKASTGFIATLANNIPMFNILDSMDSKGKILNIAFAVSASFVFGDHLGFTAGANKDMIFPVIVGKLAAGITALILANVLVPKLLEKVESYGIDETEEYENK